MSLLTNKSLAVFLIQKNVRGVHVTYTMEDNNEVTLFKTFDDTLEVDDIVVVPAKNRLGFTTCKVVTVNVQPDLDSKKPVTWIVCKVPMSSYEKCVDQESAMLDKLREVEAEKARVELSEKLSTELGDGLKLIEGMAIKVE